MNNPNWRQRGNRNGDGQEEPVIIVITEQELRRFIIRVYLCAFLLCLVSAIVWISVSAVRANVYGSIPVPPYVWFILSFILLTILSCIPETPYTRFLCWSLVIGSLIFVILFGCYYAGFTPVWLMVAAMAGSLALLALLHVYGALAPMVLLPNLICTCTVVLLGIIILFVLLLLALFIRDPRFFLASAIVFFIVICFLAPFQASFLCGRYQHVPIWQFASCANGIYMHFFFLTMCLLVFVVLGSHRKDDEGEE